VAVQWHPEENAAAEPAQQRIFDVFAERVRERSSQIGCDQRLP
jgi:gamma-glutamyl-gamma-aminobutyrate hydrolase PuuD